MRRRRRPQQRDERARALAQPARRAAPPAKAPTEYIESRATIAAAIRREAWDEAALRVLIIAATALCDADGSIDDLLAALDPAGERRDSGG